MVELRSPLQHASSLLHLLRPASVQGCSDQLIHRGIQIAALHLTSACGKSSRSLCLRLLSLLFLCILGLCGRAGVGRDVRSQGAGEVEHDRDDAAGDEQAFDCLGRQAGVGGHEGQRRADHAQEGQQEGGEGSAEYLLECRVVCVEVMLVLRSQKCKLVVTADDDLQMHMSA